MVDPGTLPNEDGASNGARQKKKPSVEPSEVLSIDAVSAPLVRETVAYWKGKIPPGRPYPARSDIDPLDVPHLLPHLSLAEVHRRPELLFRFRVFGSELTEIFQVEASGKWITKAAIGKMAYAVHNDFLPIVEQGIARAVRAGVYQDGREHVRYEVVDLPLGTPEEGVTMILSCLERT